MARIIPFPIKGAYVRLPVTATNAKIVPFPKRMRRDLPPDAVEQLAKLRLERQIQDIVSGLFPAGSLGN